jgi:histidine ammonia-lyase
VTTPFRLGQDVLSLEALAQVARGGRRVEIARNALTAMSRSRAVVDAVVAGGDAALAVYGVNTGFGASSVRTPPVSVSRSPATRSAA